MAAPLLSVNAPFTFSPPLYIFSPRKPFSSLHCSNNLHLGLHQTQIISSINGTVCWQGPTFVPLGSMVPSGGSRAKTERPASHNHFVSLRLETVKKWLSYAKWLIQRSPSLSKFLEFSEMNTQSPVFMLQSKSSPTNLGKLPRSQELWKEGLFFFPQLK